MTDYTTLITSEFNQQPKFMALVDTFANSMGEITAAAESLPAAFDLDQAVGAQLDILGLWIGQSRNIPNAISISYFGFSDTPNAGGFGDLNNPSTGSPFFDLNDPLGSSASLPDGPYLTVLQAEILKNQYDGLMDDLEAALTLIAGEPYAIYDAGTKRPTIVILVGVSSLIQSLLTNIDLLPRPAGTSYCIVFPAPAQTLTTSGTATVTANSVSKPTGANAFDSGAFDPTTFDPITVSWQSADATSQWAAGLSPNPSTSPANTNLAFGFQSAGGGVLQIIESGTVVGTFGTFAVGDTFVVDYDGVNVLYVHNGIIVRVTPHSAGSLAAQFCLFTVGASLTHLSFFVN
jgi:hypothetical protein